MASSEELAGLPDDVDTIVEACGGVTGELGAGG